jgi:hypothetical protein
MGFVAPWFVGFVVLVGVPIAIHLIGRSRARPRPFAALALLRRSERRTATKTTLQRWLLLALRALAIAAVPLILARPFFETESDLPSSVGADESAVIVVDDTLSMRRQPGGRGDTLFEAARGRAKRLVAGLGRDAEAAIVVVSAGTAAPVPELTADRGRLERAVGALAPSSRAGDLGGALKRAAQILQSATRAERRVYLISDLAAHGFAGEPPWAAGSGPPLVPIDVGGDVGSRVNRAIVGLTIEPAAELGPRAVRVTAEIASFGAAAKALPVTLRVDEQPVAKGLVDLEIDGKTQKKFVHVFPPSRDEAAGRARAHVVSVHLGRPADGGDDGLAVDDARAVRVTLPAELRVLLVDGDPRTVRREDELFYLEAALRPARGASSDGAITVTTIGADELPRERLALEGGKYDVVFLANARAPVESAAALQAFVERGGGLFLSAGDNVDADAYNGALAALLPQPLQTARRLDGEGDRFARPERGHPAIERLLRGTKPEELFAEARVTREMLVRPVADGATDRSVVLRFESGAPALLERRVGRGAVLFLLTTVDRDWSDLAIQPSFLPLVRELLRHLAGQAGGGATTAPPVAVGARHEIPLDKNNERVEVTLPSGATRDFGKEALAGRRALGFTETTEAGVYRVAVASADAPTARPTPRPDLTFAVHVDSVESDPRRVADDVLRRWQAGAAPDAKRASTAPKHRIPLWHLLGAALLLFLLAESLLLRQR